MINNFKDRFKSLKNGGRKSKKAPTSGFKVNRNVTNSIRLHRDRRARQRAEYLSTLPKDPIKRFFYRMNPKRLFKFLTSREGSIFILKAFGIGLAVLIVLILSIFAYFRKDLPKNITDLKTCSQGASTTYYDRTGQTLLWASSGNVECYPVPMDQINPNLVNAVVAVEDKDFYKHGGFSMGGVARAAISNMTGGGTTQGGSTITQQFVKNSLLSQERTVTRKMKELILSIELERTYSKKEILNAYLNEISFGSIYNGSEAAARGYFNKSAKDLTLDESAMIAAVIPAPSYYSPYGEHTDELLARQHYVLDLMVHQGYIKKKQAEEAKKVNTLAKLSTSHNKYKDILAPHFVLEVQQRLEKEYGVTNVHKAGFKVITTLDLNKQKLAEEAIAKNIYKVERDGGDNAALVSVDVQTGQVLAEVGSRSFTYPKYGELNVATTPRSPGSSFKPYDYAALMTRNKNWGAGSIFYDLNTDFGYGYRPKDYDFKEPGAMSMRQAIGGSRNTPAIKAMYIAGTQNVIDTAKKMGVVSGTSCEPNCGLSSAIGDGSEIRLDEHTNSFATFARMGKYKPITYILKIQDSKNKTIKEWKDTPGQQVIDPQVAYIINSILSDDSVRYIRGSSNFNYRGVTTALKTGTTNNMDNGWLMMYSTKIATGVWIGHHENKALWCGVYGCMEGKTGAIMASYMPKAHEGVAGAADKWEKPAGVKTVCINPVSGFATTSGGKCDIFPSWYVPRYPGTTQKVTIDTVSKKLATECTPEAAKQVITGGGLNIEIPSSDALYNNFLRPIQARYGAGGGAIPSDKDDVHSCDPGDKPSITLDKDTPYQKNGSLNFVARISPGKYPVKTVNFSIDGNILSGGSIDVSSGTKEVKYSIGSSTYDSSKTLTATVIDDVMYDASASIDVNFETTYVNNRNTVSTTSYTRYVSNRSQRNSNRF